MRAAVLTVRLKPPMFESVVQKAKFSPLEICCCKGNKVATYRVFAKKGQRLPTGKVKWFNVTKGFGFIVPDDGGQDVYVSILKVEEAKLPPLETGMSLRYTVGDEKGRQFAENLSQIESPKASSVPKHASIERRSRELDPVEELSANGAFAPFNKSKLFATALSVRAWWASTKLTVPRDDPIARIYGEALDVEPRSDTCQ